MNKRNNKEADSAWGHAKKIIKDNKKAYAECNYCSHAVQSITRLKYHLANVKGIIKVCDKVPLPVKEGFRNNFIADPYDPHLLYLKENQTRVPVPENRPCDEGQASSSAMLEERVRRMEEEIRELKEEVKKLKMDGN